MRNSAMYLNCGDKTPLTLSKSSQSAYQRHDQRPLRSAYRYVSSQIH